MVGPTAPRGASALRAYTLAESAASHWWVLALRGLAAVLFGFAAIAWPGVTLTVLVMLYGVFSLADGILALVAGIRARWNGLLLAGILGVVVGLAALLWPGITALALLFLIAAWALLTGALQLVAAMQLRRAVAGEWLLGRAGAAAIAIGILLVFNPQAGALSVLWLIGAFAIAYGVVLLGLAFRLRSLPSRLASGPR
jgi:uncharacterized membrane protein HdeD (DUF308 family)